MLIIKHSADAVPVDAAVINADDFYGADAYQVIAILSKDGATRATRRHLRVVDDQVCGMLRRD